MTIKDKDKAVSTIKRLLMFDIHHCYDCSWTGPVHKMKKSNSKKNKLCPDCNIIQFSLVNPNVRSKIESAESLFLQSLRVYSSDFTESPREMARLVIRSVIESFNLDDDEIEDLYLRVHNLKLYE